MKRFSILLGVVAVVALLTVTGAFAEEAKKGPGGRGGGGATGEIVKIDGKNITIKSAREGAPDVTGAIDDATEVFAEVPVKLADLKVGDRVSIQQGDKRAYGEITKIEGKNVTVKGMRGDPQTIAVEADAVIVVMAKAKTEDLKVGMQVRASVREGKIARITIRAPEKK